ncbi:DUF6257 family protein [Streptomyces sp. NPDC006879]|uniref:DUF6257 family protein n=1 Tax=Streptomyces sp. NPDC006879 TaxID=3364767 RepID=UPI0036A76622
MAKDPKFTAGEITKMAWLTARMSKRGLAGENVYQGDLEKKFSRIVDGARDREAKAIRAAAKAEKKRK